MLPGWLALSAQPEPWKLLSPDKKVEVSIFIDRGSLSYSVLYNRKVAIQKSPLGIDMGDQSFSSGLRWMRKSSSQINENYSLMVGKRLTNQQLGNELILSFTNANNKNVDVVFRAYNDGMAFRYFFPDQDSFNTPHNQRVIGIFSFQKKAEVGFSLTI